MRLRASGAGCVVATFQRIVGGCTRRKLHTANPVEATGRRIDRWAMHGVCSVKGRNFRAALTIVAPEQSQQFVGCQLATYVSSIQQAVCQVAFIGVEP